MSSGLCGCVFWCSGPFTPESPTQLEIGSCIFPLFAEGKVRHWGLSNETTFGVCQMVQAADKLGVPRPVSIQNSFSLIHRYAGWQGLSQRGGWTADPVLSVHLSRFSCRRRRFEESLVPGVRHIYVSPKFLLLTKLMCSSLDGS
jgi:hypothetical protein